MRFMTPRRGWKRVRSRGVKAERSSGVCFDGRRALCMVHAAAAAAGAARVSERGGDGGCGDNGTPGTAATLLLARTRAALRSWRE
jgi:hypothetical protein